MSPLLASYLTGVIVLLLFCWTNGMDHSKNWLGTVLIILIWPLTLPVMVVVMRIGWNKEQRAKQDAGTK